MELPIKIAANTFIQILGRVVGSGTTFLITIFIARYFGVVGFGDFIKITSFVAIFYLMADFGLNAIFLRERGDKDLPKLLGLRIFIACFLIILAITIPLFLPFNEATSQGFTPFVRLGIAIYSFTILTQAVFITSNAIFQKKLRYDLSVFASSAGQLITLVIVSILLIFKASLLQLLLAFLVGGSFMAALSILFVRREMRGVLFSFNWQFIKKITVTTFPLGITLIFNLIYFRADSFLLALMRPTSEVGIYGLAFKFFEFPLAIPTFFGNAIYPILLRNRDTNNFGKMIFLSSVLLFLSSLVLLLILFVAAPLLGFIKKDFILSVLPFRILILSLPLFFLSSLFQWGLVARGYQKILALIYFFSMILNIILNILFIPQYSFLASSIITGVSEGIVFILMLIFILKSFKEGVDKRRPN